ncbi:hypothetical protein Bca101_074833 [Brassica carinata]
MTDVKGKGICYEKDDEPIQLTDQDDSPTIRDYRLSLIGKILNPKKQSVEKLIQTMPVQWEMQDKITANDLGNGKAAHHRYDEHNERFPGKHGRHDRKIRSTFTRQSSRYAPYEKKKQHSWRIKDHSKTREDVNMKRIAPYVSIPRTGDIGGSSTQQSDGVMMQDTQQSSGKRIASLMVTPSRHALDDNVTKRPTVSPRLLTFSPTEEVLPVDAQVIGALNDMEITSNSAERLNDADKSEGGNEDDLLGEDLMDMKADIVKLTERDAGNDKGVLERSKPSSSSRRGGKRRAPLGLLRKKAEFLHLEAPLWSGELFERQYTQG